MLCYLLMVILFLACDFNYKEVTGVLFFYNILSLIKNPTYKPSTKDFDDILLMFNLLQVIKMAKYHIPIQNTPNIIFYNMTKHDLSEICKSCYHHHKNAALSYHWHSKIMFFYWCILINISTLLINNG